MDEEKLIAFDVSVLKKGEKINISTQKATEKFDNDYFEEQSQVSFDQTEESDVQ